MEKHYETAMKVSESSPIQLETVRKYGLVISRAEKNAEELWEQKLLMLPFLSLL